MISIINFFLISKNVIYTNGYSMHEEHGAYPENTRRKKKEQTKKKTNPQINYKERELMKEGRESLVVSPQARD